MSTKKNIIANYFGQVYIILIGLLVTPIYLKYLGAEAFGLVGFFTLLLTWLNLLDLGLTPTLGREISIARSLNRSFDDFRVVLNSFQFIFIVVAIFIFIFFYNNSILISNEWISSEILSVSDISYCVVLMGAMFGLKWLSGLYRSGIVGMEDQVFLNLILITTATFKYVGSVLLLTFYNVDIRGFFEYQLLIGILELLILYSRLHVIIPKKINTDIIIFSLEKIIKIAPFALTIGYTSGVWVMSTQIDKLILSGKLPLAEFGYFSLVVIVSGSVLLLSGPISQAVLPKMTLLIANGSLEDVKKLYKKSTQFQVWICVSVSIFIAFYSKEIIYAWTGDIDAAIWSKDILFWLSLGNGALIVSGIQYSLQISFGKLNMHFWGSTISAIVSIPIVYLAIHFYGALGAAMSWFCLRSIWCLIWPLLVHKKFLPGFHWNWFLNDVIKLVCPMLIIIFLVKYLIQISITESQLSTIYQLLLSFFIYFSFVSLSCSTTKDFLVKKVLHK